MALTSYLWWAPMRLTHSRRPHGHALLMAAPELARVCEGLVADPSTLRLTVLPLPQILPPEPGLAPGRRKAYPCRPYRP